MTRYLDEPKTLAGRLAAQLLSRIVNAQLCTYVPGEWVRHPSGKVGKVYEDLGKTVHVFCLDFGFLIWNKDGLRMVAPTE